MINTRYPINLSKAALAAIEPCMGEHEVRADVNAMRRERTTAEELLEVCLSGLEEGEPDYEELADGWREYVSAVVSAANRKVVGVRFVREWTPDEGEPDAMSAYCSLVVTVRDEEGFKAEYPVGAVVGVPGYLRGTAEACGSTRGMISAEWSDSSDWSELPDEFAAEAALEAISAQADRLLREALSVRSHEVAS